MTEDEKDVKEFEEWLKLKYPNFSSVFGHKRMLETWLASRRTLRERTKADHSKGEKDG